MSNHKTSAATVRQNGEPKSLAETGGQIVRGKGFAPVQSKSEDDADVRQQNPDDAESAKLAALDCSDAGVPLLQSCVALTPDCVWTFLIRLLFGKENCLRVHIID